MYQNNHQAGAETFMLIGFDAVKISLLNFYFLGGVVKS